jgi:galactokinase
VSAVTAAFEKVTGRRPDGLWITPGRVNLIGEHTDYNEGLVLPIAIDRSAVVAARLRSDGVVRCSSVQMSGEICMRIDEVRPGCDCGWASHLLGALWALRRAGATILGADLVVDSDVPVGAGLASSAALAVAAALAVTELTGERMSDADLARCCQLGERSIAGAPTGVMDQMAVLAGRAGHALFLDCRTLTYQRVPFQPETESASLLVIDTRVRHANSGRGYRTRREESARAAAELGLESLRDGTREMVDARLSGVLQRRARHVVEENARVVRTVEMLHADRLAQVGVLMDESHSSLRDDYEVSCAELDVAVAAARSAGALGARMTGGGFGGCAIALVPVNDADAVAESVHAAFSERGFTAPHVFAVATADGARRCV